MRTKYYRQLKRKNCIYFECSKRRFGCKGKLKYLINDNKWFQINECDINIEHDIITFKEFYIDYINHNLNEYNMAYRKYLRYYVKSVFTNNEISTNDNIFIKFKNKFNVKLELTNKEINEIKHSVFGELNSLDFEDLLKKIKIDKDYKLEINTTDISYEIKINNKDINRKERIFIITTDNMKKYLNNNEITNFFLDITYKIIPKKLRNINCLHCQV